MKITFFPVIAALRRDPRGASPIIWLKVIPAVAVCIFVFNPCCPLFAQENASVAWISAETRLTDPANDPGWRDLMVRLAPHRTRQSSFEEKRYFPFKKAPVRLTGEIRIIPGRGLSLRYVSPEEQIMIVDAQGLLIRDRDGRERQVPSDRRAQAATAALVNVLRFDLVKLQLEFEVHGRREGAAWSMAFVPRDPNLATLLGVLAVSGEGDALTRIEMIKSQTQRIAIEVSETREAVLFTGDTIRRFFR